MKIRSIIIFLFFLSFLLSLLAGAFAQDKKIDSLLLVLKSSNEDTNKVNRLNDLSDKLWRIGEYEKSMQQAGNALSLSGKINFKKGKAIAYDNIGIVYFHQGRHAEALKNYFEALKLIEETGDKKGIASTYNNIGAIFDIQNNYPEALKNYFASLKLMQEVGDKKGIASLYHNIGIVFYMQHKIPEALKNYFEALKINEKIENKNALANNYVGIGIIYLEQHKVKEALKTYSDALNILEEIGDKAGITDCYINLAAIFTEQKKFNEAKEYLNKAVSLSKKIGYKEWIKESYYDLSRLDSIQGNWKGAYEYHKFYSDIKDSILNEESSKQITEMQIKYETEKKEQQINLLNKDKELQDAQLNRQKIVIWSVAGGLLVVLILSLFIFRERRKSEKLLLNILPVETAKELKINGKSTAKHYESVTVMFTDFKNFTQIAEKLSAEKLVSELDFLFKKFDEIISKYNIEKIKTIGDAYMCASGLPTPNNNHAESIVKAALEIQEWMMNGYRLSVNGNQSTTTDHRPPTTDYWQLRIGIHTGAVTAGVVGDKKFAYDIWGDTVNTASRMESSGEAWKINISGNTYQLVKDQFNCEFRGKIPAKNKGEIDMYFVERII